MCVSWVFCYIDFLQSSSFRHHEESPHNVTAKPRGLRQFPRQPSASADCYAPLIKCSSVDLNALDPMALPDAFMLFERGKFAMIADHRQFAARIHIRIGHQLCFPCLPLKNARIGPYRVDAL